MCSPAETNRQRCRARSTNQLSRLYIVSHLTDEARKFHEIQRSISGISRKLLVEHLREMERAGLVDRKPCPRVSSKDEYALTSSGRKLKDMAEALGLRGRAAPAETESGLRLHPGKSIGRPHSSASYR